MPERIHNILNTQSPELSGVLNDFIDFAEEHTASGYRVVSMGYRQKDFAVDDPAQLIPVDILRVGCLATPNNEKQIASARLLSIANIGGSGIMAGQEIFSVIYQSTFSDATFKIGNTTERSEVDIQDPATVSRFLSGIVKLEETGGIRPITGKSK